MKFLVLGGCGLQGRAVLHDLSHSPGVDHIICADADLSGLETISSFLNMDLIEPVAVDLSDEEALASLMQRDIDVVIDVLPARFLNRVAGAAVDAGVHLVNTMYRHMMDPQLDTLARARSVTIMPEAGLDPGIDLVLCGYGVSRLDEVHEIHSLCGGFPVPEAAGNPLQYKVTWTWEGVLLSYKRPAVMMIDGEVVRVPPRDQHAEKWVETLEFPGVGTLESVPNGDAMVFADYLGVTDTIRSASRRFLRWPGHSANWRLLTGLGFLDDEPVPGLPEGVTPFEFMVHHLGPRLQYGRDEQDLVVMRNEIAGLKGSKEKRFVFDMVDRRDPQTGLFAMNRTVGYTASIVAQLIASGDITRRGLLTAVRDIPYEPFLEEIRNRGIVIRETEVV